MKMAWWYFIKNQWFYAQICHHNVDHLASWFCTCYAMVHMWCLIIVFIYLIANKNIYIVGRFSEFISAIFSSTTYRLMALIVYACVTKRSSLILSSCHLELVILENRRPGPILHFLNKMVQNIIIDYVCNTLYYCL